MTFPDLGVPYGVFGPSDLPGIMEDGSGYVVTDDEDDGNANSMGGVLTDVASYITANNNTKLNLARVR